MRPNAAKVLMREGGRVLNAWCSIPSAYVAEVLGHQGFDTVTIDLQHGAIDYMAAFHMLQAVSATPATPFARVPWNEPGLLMKLLDSGAYGLICPMINSRRDCEDFVGACRYPPMGWRSFGPNRVVQYAGSDYWQHANREIILLAQVETAEAVANIDDILDVPGLDGIYVGPGDLSLYAVHGAYCAARSCCNATGLEKGARPQSIRRCAHGWRADGPHTLFGGFSILFCADRHAHVDQCGQGHGGSCQERVISGQDQHGAILVPTFGEDN